MPEVDLRALFEFVANDFNHRCATERGFRVRFEGLRRRILARVNGRSWWFELDDCRVDGVHDGEVGEPDILFEADDPAIVRDVFSGRLGATRAIMARKVRIDASMPDLILIKRLLDDEKARIARFLEDYESTRGAAPALAANGGEPATTAEGTTPTPTPVTAPAKTRKTMIFGAPDGPK